MAATSPEILSETRDDALRRESTDGHVAALTGLRGFAALVVVLVHGSSLTEHPWIGFHGYGPIALFTLSGFLLFQPWSRWSFGLSTRPSLRTFTRRRAWRLFPAYLVVLAIVTLIYPPSRPEDLRQWSHALTLTSIYDPEGRLPGLEHTWSLGTEVTWYLALPFTGLLLWALVHRFAIRPVRGMAVLFVLSLVIGAAWRWFIGFRLSEDGQRIMFPTWLPAYLACFVGGALIGHLVIAHRHGRAESRALRFLASRGWLVLTLASGALLVANSRLGGPWTFAPATFSEINTRFVMCTLAALTLLAGVAASDPRSVVPRLFSAPWLEAIGRWSYGIYLWHMPFVVISWEQGLIARDGTSFVVWMACLVAVSTALGAVTYAFVEKPAIAFSKRTSPALR